MRIFTVLFLLFLSLSHIASAQDAAVTPVAATDLGKPLGTEPHDTSLDNRVALATKMHELRPTKDQIEAAVEQVAASQPAAEQEAFKTAMRSALNYKAIEKISIDAMVDVYTEPELQAMVDYYSKPEAKSAAAKDPEYAKRVYPEITRMLDQAMMRVRTGGQ